MFTAWSGIAHPRVKTACPKTFPDHSLPRDNDSVLLFFLDGISGGHVPLLLGFVDESPALGLVSHTIQNTRGLNNGMSTNALCSGLQQGIWDTERREELGPTPGTQKL